MTTIQESETFNTYQAAKAAGITYRQLDYWLRTGMITLEEGPETPGSGHRRRFTTAEVQALIEMAAITRAAREILREMQSGALWNAARGKGPHER